MCVKAPVAKVGRSNRLGRASSSRAASVPGASLWVRCSANCPISGNREQRWVLARAVCPLMIQGGHAGRILNGLFLKAWRALSYYTFEPLRCLVLGLWGRQ
jgi:hypothetical protein